MKFCYTLTFLGFNPNGGRDFRINSQIWLQSDPGEGLAQLTAAELTSYALFVQTEIRRVWSTASNPGLSSGQAGTAPAVRVYNSSIDTITCTPPPIQVHARDTGVTVGLWANRLLTNPVPNPVLGEILITVNRVANGRAFMSMSTQSGQLYFYLPPLPAGTPVPAYVDSMQVHNTAAHEFGHALGLNDRYHYVGNGRATNSNADPNSNFNFVCASISDAPMYLPCLFDPLITYDSGSFVESPPDYFQEPYCILGGNTPQPNYDSPSTGPGIYDAEYSTQFGWLHNLYSAGFSPNHSFGLSHQLRGTSDPPGLLYQQLYSDDYTHPLEICVITKVQLDVVLNLVPDTILPLTVGQECFSNRDEDEMAESRGFNRRIFSQFLFIIDETGRSSCGVNELVPNATATTGGRFFFNSAGNYRGTFLGIAYEDDLDKDGNGGIVVSDIYFDKNQTELKNGSIGKLGIQDIMSYRMSEFKTSSPNPNSWGLKEVMNGTDNILGFINPFLSAQRSPTSLSIRQAIAESLNDNTYRSLVPNITTMAVFGGPKVPYFLNAVNRISGGTAVNQAFSGNKFFRDYQSTSRGRVGDDEDLFSGVGIASPLARVIWNGRSTIYDMALAVTAVPGPGIVMGWTPESEGSFVRLHAEFTSRPAGGGGILQNYYIIAPYYRNRRFIMILSMT